MFKKIREEGEKNLKKVIYSNLDSVTEMVTVKRELNLAIKQGKKIISENEIELKK